MTKYESQKEWVRNNKDKVKAAGYRYLENNPEKKLLKSSKANAKAKNLEHTITFGDIVIPTRGPYLGIELTTKVQQRNTASTLSIDRIDSDKGYIPGNVQVISSLANLMKSYATEAQLVTFSNNVLKLHANRI
jgi:hypothetical protein